MGLGNLCSSIMSTFLTSLPSFCGDTHNQVERIGVERSRAAAANADIVVMVVDAQVGARVFV